MKMAFATSRPALLALAASLILQPLSHAASRDDVPLGPPAIPTTPLATTEQAIDQRLEGKFFFLRGFYQDDKLRFDTDGKAVGNPQKGSFTLSALEVTKVRSNKHSIIIDADRIGLHFFGGLPYEDDSKPFERIKVSKKPIEITIDRLDITPEKKKKHKDKDDREATSTVAKAATPAPAAAETTGVANPPDVTFDDADSKTAPATAKSVAVPSPSVTARLAAEALRHDPSESWKQLSRALDQVFATGLDDSVIATLPDYWQVYFATKAGKQQAERIDNSVLHPGSNGVVAPRLLSSLDPSSNDYAQKNNIAGMTLLSTVVGASGQPGSVAIVRPIGFGLDEQAVAAVQKAHFRPGLRDGQPVPVIVNVQVTFRIYSDGTRPQPGAMPPATPAANPAANPASAPQPSRGNGKELAAMTKP